MLFTVTSIIGLKVLAGYDTVGKVKDVYLDDKSWKIRYLVVDTGGWLSHHEVLLAPQCFAALTLDLEELKTNLTKAQVENSPPIAADMPNSRRYEESLHDHYGWETYWTGPFYSMPGMYFFPKELEERTLRAEQDKPKGQLPEEVGSASYVSDHRDAHLRSSADILRHKAHALDGEVGHIEDLLFDSDDWQITHFVIDTHNWLPGKHVTVDLGTVKHTGWEDGEVNFSMTREAIKGAPEVSRLDVIDSSFQKNISKYYRGVNQRDAGPIISGW